MCDKRTCSASRALPDPRSLVTGTGRVAATRFPRRERVVWWPPLGPPGTVRQDSCVRQSLSAASRGKLAGIRAIRIGPAYRGCTVSIESAGTSRRRSVGRATCTVVEDESVRLWMMPLAVCRGLSRATPVTLAVKYSLLTACHVRKAPDASGGGAGRWSFPGRSVALGSPVFLDTGASMGTVGSRGSTSCVRARSHYDGVTVRGCPG